MNGKQVLIVEDEPILRDLLSLIVEDTGATVVAVETAQEGVGLLSKMPWSVIITDVCTPGITDGWDLAWAAHERRLGISIIVTSGGNSHFAKPLPPCATFIAKPWSMDQMVLLLLRCAERTARNQ
jgi:DNA-binding NtrC family response regulator